MITGPESHRTMEILRAIAFPFVEQAPKRNNKSSISRKDRDTKMLLESFRHRFPRRRKHEQSRTIDRPSPSYPVRSFPLPLFREESEQTARAGFCHWHNGLGLQPPSRGRADRARLPARVSDRRQATISSADPTR